MKSEVCRVSLLAIRSFLYLQFIHHGVCMLGLQSGENWRLLSRILAKTLHFQGLFCHTHTHSVIAFAVSHFLKNGRLRTRKRRCRKLHVASNAGSLGQSRAHTFPVYTALQLRKTATFPHQSDVPTRSIHWPKSQQKQNKRDPSARSYSDPTARSWSSVWPPIVLVSRGVTCGESVAMGGST